MVDEEEELFAILLFMCKTTRNKLTTGILSRCTLHICFVRVGGLFSLQTKGIQVFEHEHFSHWTLKIPVFGRKTSFHPYDQKLISSWLLMSKQVLNTCEYCASSVDIF